VERELKLLSKTTRERDSLLEKKIKEREQTISLELKEAVGMVVWKEEADMMGGSYFLLGLCSD